ncbi:MAG: fructose-1,6-bisphosphatase [Proteobacteria bacterium]|nr:fructose-1,6-bisphosphatase [Pseudomonadota bacterium]
MESHDTQSQFGSAEIALLRLLAERFPTIDAAAAEIAHLRAVLTLPKGTVHVVSDVHGEHKKLQHIVNNASGFMRPFIDRVFGSKLGAGEKQILLNTIYYPSQLFEHLGLRRGQHGDRAAFVKRTIRRQFKLLQALRSRHTLDHVEDLFPDHYRKLFRELLWEAREDRQSAFVTAMLVGLIEQRKGLSAVRWASRVIRNLSVFELVVAGDLGDRGPRLDKVADILIRQPRVRITWGNHDVSWMGACLGHRALIATVLRVSLRYRRIAQIEEGYGISIAPLEKLARDCYGDDPAERFGARGDEGIRPPAEVARMQKAIAIIQFKLENQLIADNPGYHMKRRELMDALDLERGVVTLDGREYPLTDTHLPTVDRASPAALSDDESVCVEALRDSFTASQRLWEHVKHWARVGSTYLIRDGHLIFHGCVPVDEAGELLALEVDGKVQKGRALFDALDVVVQRAVRQRLEPDLDMLWYLWAGPRSPLFGKNEMTSFERYFIADQTTHKEHKNPYFELIHDASFCRRVLDEFGADPDIGMIVNGHVPVKPDRGEEPVKESRKAITIDGAFSEAYSDRGYTLILDCDGARLAEHHHFESVAEALHSGADIVPTVREVRSHDAARLVGDTEAAAEIHAKINALERLSTAYRANVIAERE